MIVTFRKSFEKDLSKLRDADLLRKIQAVIEEAEAAINLVDVNNPTTIVPKSSKTRPGCSFRLPD